jgi:hypothetical protein
MVEGNARAGREQREDWEEMERTFREDAGEKQWFSFLRWDIQRVSKILEVVAQKKHSQQPNASKEACASVT